MSHTYMCLSLSVCFCQPVSVRLSLSFASLPQPPPLIKYALCLLCAPHKPAMRFPDPTEDPSATDDRAPPLRINRAECTPDQTTKSWDVSRGRRFPWSPRGVAVGPHNGV